MTSTRVAIVGGGISGLSTAYFLSQVGIPSTVIEKSERLGGLIHTERIEGCVLEAGPDSYLAAKPAVTELAHELTDLGRQIIGSNDECRRIFILHREKLVPLPRGMVMIAPAEWAPVLQSRLFSTRTKLRFLKETLMPPCERADDISVAELVQSHFGDEVLENVAEPLLSGVYGGDSESLSAKSVLPRFLDYETKYGSLIKGARLEHRRSRSGSIFLSFAGGMQSLTDTLTGAITGRAEIRRSEVSKIERIPAGWRIYTSDTDFEADHIVLACPAHAGARLLESSVPALTRELDGIPYSSAILVTLVYERAKFGDPLNGFGFLVPRSERKIISAMTWVSTKFSSRIPPHSVALRAFIVDPQANQLLKTPETEIVRLVEGELKRIMSITSKPRLTRVQFWPKSMPQYVVGHEDRKQRIAALLESSPGLHLVGNAYDGVGIPDCVRLAKETAKKIANAAK